MKSVSRNITNTDECSPFDCSNDCESHTPEWFALGRDLKSCIQIVIKGCSLSGASFDHKAVGYRVAYLECLEPLSDLATSCLIFNTFSLVAGKRP